MGHQSRTRTIPTAVVGMGWWGQHLVDVLQRTPIGLDVVATVDHDPARGTTRDLGEVLADDRVEAVILCTPHSSHADQIMTCAAARKHVYCEKPLALRAADARRAVETCAGAGLVLGIGHERRFEPAMREVARLVSSGELGTILHVEGAFSHDKFRMLPPDSWRGSQREAPAAGMTGMGIHLTDSFIAMFGPVARVHALVARRSLPLETGDVVSVNLCFVSGATGSLSAVSATPFYARYAVFGSQAWVETREKQHPEDGSASIITCCRRGGAPTSSEPPVADAVLANLRAFVAAIEGKAAYPFTDAELVHNIEVLEAIATSAATGDVVEVERSPTRMGL